MNSSFLAEILDACRVAWNRPDRQDVTNAASVGLAVALFEAVELDVVARTKTIDGDRVSSDARDANIRQNDKLWAGWLEVAAPILQAVSHGTQESEQVARLRRFVDRVRRHLAVPTEKMIQAMRDCEEGRGIPLEEIRNELRGRLLTRVST